MHHAYIDRFAQQDSPAGRLDARVKLVAILAYSAVLISFDSYALAEMAPMALLPLAMLVLGKVPLWFGLRRVAILSPLIVMLALSCVLYDRQPHFVALGPWSAAIAGGWIRAADITVKFTLGVLALTALMSTTPFGLLLEAIVRMGVGRLLVMALALLYRYLFVLVDEAMRIRRARDFRGAALAPAGRRLKASAGVLGSLLVRTLDRSERIHLAMCARGFDGQPRGLHRLRLRWPDLAFGAAVAGYLTVCRILPYL